LHEHVNHDDDNHHDDVNHHNHHDDPPGLRGLYLAVYGQRGRGRHFPVPDVGAAEK
jgi:hypothetical protein